MTQRLAYALMLAFGMLIVGAVPAFAAEPVVVIDTDKPELGPAASTSYLAWFVSVPGPDAHTNVWAQAIGDDAPFRVNPPGSSAYTGGIDGSTLVYQLSEPMDAKPDLAMLDLETRTELDVPDEVNTPRSEYAPTISGTHLLFGRGIRNGSSVVLFDTATGESQVLYSKTNTDKRYFDIIPTQVNGNYAVWQQVVYKGDRVIDGDVWLYDIVAATRTRIPSEDGVWKYGPSVDAQGTMYFGRSNLNCGENAELLERQIDGTEGVLFTLPIGQDFAFSFAVDNPDGSNDVYFDQGSCKGKNFGDIWRLPGV